MFGRARAADRLRPARGGGGRPRPASLLALGVFTLALATLVAVPVHWLAKGSEATAGSLAGLGVLAAEAGGAAERGELRELAARSAHGGPLPLETHSARLADLARISKPRPTSLRIPALGVRAPVRPVGVADRLVEVPADAGVVGWYRHGASPGGPGSAVLVGHVDLDGRPGVFFGLRKLEPGATVTVGFARGPARSFRVAARRIYGKGRLPADLVFAESGRPYITLVTCGGDFDAAQREYEANVVVVATLVSRAPETRGASR